MKYHYTGGIKQCERPGCTNTFKPSNWIHKYCSPKCKMAVFASGFKAEHKDYWREYQKKKKLDRVKTSGIEKPPYNPKKCLTCLLPLGHTWNRYRHDACLHRMSPYLTGGIDEYTQAIG